MVKVVRSWQERNTRLSSYRPAAADDIGLFVYSMILKARHAAANRREGVIRVLREKYDSQVYILRCNGLKCAFVFPRRIKRAAIVENFHCYTKPYTYSDKSYLVSTTSYIPLTKTIVPKKKDQ